VRTSTGLRASELAALAVEIEASGLRWFVAPGEPYDPAGFAMVRLAAPLARPADLGAGARWAGGAVEIAIQDASDTHYFYPASSIKLLAAIAAVEKLNALERDFGAGLTLDSPMSLGPVRSGEAAPEPTTLRREIHELFVVSDNDAFNRLYDFVGPDGLRQAIDRWGLERTWLTHRLAGGFSAADNAAAPGFSIAGTRRTVTEARRESISTPIPADASRLATTGLRCGSAVMRGGEAVAGPIDFSNSNRTTLADLQHMLMRLVLPGATPGPELDLSAEQRAFLLASAAMLPRESAEPAYDPAAYPDDHVKFLLPGLLRVAPVNDWLIVNKIGLAYGYVSENSYVEHRPSGRGLFVAAVIHRNPDGVFNDDAYDYDTTLAEMARLGELVGRTLAPGAEATPAPAP
jgi:hypothetical protein